MVSNSRIITPESLAAEVGMDASKLAEIQQQSIDARIEEIYKRNGALAVLREDALKGDTFVGSLNEYALVELMGVALGGRMIVDRASGHFYFFEDFKGGVFSRVTKEEAGRRLSQVYVGLPALSAKLKPLEMRPPTVRTMSGVLSAAVGTFGEDYPWGGDPSVHPVEIARPLKNGLLTFSLLRDEPPTFKPTISPSDRALCRVPVEYDPSAGNVPSRLLEKLLIPSLGSREIAEDFLDDLAGSWLGGGLWPFVFALCGDADTGKSQLVELIRILVGLEHCRSLTSREISEKFGLSFLSGAISTVIFNDAPESALGGETGSLVKALTGSDPLESRGVFASMPVMIKGEKVFVISSNSVPKIDLNDDVAAWDRRVRPYFFRKYHVENIIPNFAAYLLKAEGATILNRLVEGARRRIRLSLDGKRPAMLPPMEELMSEILCRSCPVASYLEARITSESGHQILRSDLYSMFRDTLRDRDRDEWPAKKFNKRAEEVMKRTFGALLSNSISGGKGWRGVRLKSEFEVQNAD